MLNATIDYTSFIEYKVGLFIWKVVPPILIVLGTIGNVLSIIVLTRKAIRLSTTAFYLTVLALSDLVVLYSGLLRQWIRLVFKIEVRDLSNAGCKINVWIVNTSLQYSAWILIAVTFERFVSVWFPLNVRSICTRRSAVVSLSLILACLFLLNSHMLYGLGFKDDINGTVIERCTGMNTDYVSFFSKTWPWIDLNILFVLPCLVLVSGNSLILFKVKNSQKLAKPRSVLSVKTRNRQGQRASGGKQLSMTIMLLTLNIVFLTCSLPAGIFIIGESYWFNDAIQSNDSHKFAVLELCQAIVHILMYTNNALNFLLYCLSGTKFRKEVLRMFCTSKIGHSAPMPKSDKIGEKNRVVIRSNPTKRAQSDASSASFETDRDLSDVAATSSDVGMSTISYSIQARRSI